MIAVVIRGTIRGDPETSGGFDCVYVGTQEEEFPAVSFLLPFHHLLHPVVGILVARVFHPVRRDHKDRFLRTILLPGIFVNIPDMTDRTADGIQQSRAAANIIILLCDFRYFIQGYAVMKHLSFVIEQHRGHQHIAFRLPLFFQHTVVSADRIALQPAHGTAAVQDHHQFSQILFHCVHPPVFFIYDAVAFVQTQIREYTKLGPGAVFQTTPEYPEFCWTELIINAVAHRDYSIKGTDIQIKMFDDHFVVESPGMLPGLVRVNNIREFHFSRNPKIIEFLNEYDLVKEFGEGVDRIFRDMQDAGLPEPEYKQSEFMLYATLKNKTWGLENGSWESLTGDNPDSGQAETSGQANKTSEQANKTSAVLLKTAQNKQRILSYLAENGKAGTKVLADILSLSQDRVRVILAEMIKEGTVVAEGRTNTRVYRLAVDR